MNKKINKNTLKSGDQGENGEKASDLSDDDLESFGSDDDVRSDEEMLDIPEAETPILVESETDSDYSDP